MLKIQLFCIPNTNVWLYILAHIKTLYAMLPFSCEHGERAGSFVLWLYCNPLSQPDLMLLSNTSLSFFFHPFPSQISSFSVFVRFLNLRQFTGTHGTDGVDREDASAPWSSLYPSVYLFIFLLLFDSILSRQRNKNMSFILQEWHISQPCCFCLITSV